MEKKKDIIRVALADDHVLIRNALAILVDGFEGCNVISQSGNGKELTEALTEEAVPDIILLDLNMPEMDGFETAKWLQKNFPQIKVLVLTMYDSEFSLIRLLQSGVKGFLKKDVHPDELKFAIFSVMQSGFYYSNNTSRKLVHLLQNNNEGLMNLQNAILSEQEFFFLKLACSERTYKEIAHQMRLSTRTIDTLRDHLFIKLDVKSRVGLAMIAIKNGIVAI